MLSEVCLTFYRRLLQCSFPRMWRNWQTRRLQVPVGATPWRFDSSHPHLTSLKTPALNLTIQRPLED